MLLNSFYDQILCAIWPRVTPNRQSVFEVEKKIRVILSEPRDIGEHEPDQLSVFYYTDSNGE